MDIRHLAIDVFNWAEEVFPGRTDAGMFVKLFQELGELSKSVTPDEREDEWADVMILLLDYAEKHKINPTFAVLRKLGTNKRRNWRITDLGTMQHE